MKKGLTQFVSNLCFSYGSRHYLFWTNHSCDKKTRTVLSVLLVWSEWRDLLAARLAFGNARGGIAIATLSIASLFVWDEPLM